VLSVSSTTTLAILTGTQLGLVVPDGDAAKLVTATATLTTLVGAMLLLARLLRLGFVANFISASVLTGFKAGIGLVIVLDQVPKLLGIHITKQGFFVDLLSVAQHLPETSLTTLAVAVATFAVILGMERLWPHAPAPLIAVGGGIAAAWFLGLQELGVSTVGVIPQGFSSLTMPDPTLIEQLVPGALGIALMSFTETIAASHAFARPGDPRIDANRELIATGAANVGGAFFGAMPAGGGPRTAVVRAAGGRSQVASLVTAGVAVATMLLPRLCSACCPTPRAASSSSFRRADTASGIRYHSQSAHDGVSLGNRCRAGVLVLGLKGIGGDHPVADRAVEPECQPARMVIGRAAPAAACRRKNRMRRSRAC
jgi:MFS superfamily sulfate permease-like transporter